MTLNKVHHYLLYAALLSCMGLSSFVLKAQTVNTEEALDTIFLHLPSRDYPINRDALPEVSYIEHLNQGVNYSTSDLHVELLYPEYRNLTSQELSMARKHKNLISSTLKASWTLSYYRRKPQLDITFCPIVKVGGKLRRLVSCKIVITDADGKRIATKQNEHNSAAKAKQMVNAPDGRYTHQSVLAEGKWVKIGIKEEGMYELTAATLKEWGFADISRVKLYGYGGRILPEALEFEGSNALVDDLNEVPLYRKSGSLLFYAEGLVRWKYDRNLRRYQHTDNHYANYSCYFITEGANPLTMETIEGDTESVRTITEIPSYALYDGNSEMWYQGGRRLFDAYDFSVGNTHSYRIDAPGATTGSTTQATLDISFSAANLISSTQVQVAVNNKTIGTMKVAQLSNNEAARVATSSYTISTLASNNNVQFTTNNSYPARLDYIRLTYPRNLNGNAQPYSFETGATDSVALLINNADEGTQVWELAHGGIATRRVASKINGTTLQTAPLAPDTRYAIVNVNRSYPAPLQFSTTPNQNLHADKNYQMVIVVPSSGKMMAQAERLAKIHEEQDSFRVKVVRARDIYNEFSSGTPDATAIRRYMKMLYDRAQTEEEMPRFLIFFGMGSADNRMLTPINTGKNANDYLLCYEMDNSSVSIGDLNSYATEDYFGMLDDNEGVNILNEKMDIAIGRLCCSDDEEARILVDKIQAYITNKDASYWKNDILLMGDYGDNNGHMEDAERVSKVIETTDPYLNIYKVYPDSYTWTVSATGHTFPNASRRIESIMTSGVSLINYSGHGSPTQLSHGALITDKMLSRIKVPRLPVWVLASCEIFPYDAEEENMGRSAMLQENGGCIAFLSPTRSVYASYNNPLNRALTGYLLTHSAPTPNGRYTLGESLAMAKADMVTSSTDKTMNKMKFALIGDPAITLATPNARMVLDSINGEALGDTIRTLHAGSVARLSGHIEGTPCDTAYNGIASARIYDCEKLVTCRKNVYTDNCNPFEYITRDDCLFTGTSEIKGGKFSVDVTIPIDINYSEATARLSFYGIDDQRKLECSGYYEGISLHGTDTLVVNDQEPPHVLLYFGTEDFPYGGVIGTNAVLQAKITDNYGINTSLNGLGHDMCLILDDDYAHPITVNNYFTLDFGSYNSGHLAYPMENLTPGNHKLTLRVWDLNNNNTLSYLSFRVSTNPEEEGVFSVQSSQNPVFNGTQLIVTLPSDQKGDPVHITIHSAEGRLLWEYTYTPGLHQRYINIPWAGTTSGGAKLENGIYMLRATQAGKHAKGRKIMIKR